MSDEFEKLERPRVEAMEEILGQPFKVLDDGFIRVVDYMGTDQSVVQAARVSYGKGTKKVHQDRGLIRYLMRHRHTTPFEMCEIKFHLRVPMDCWRQWIRHRTACLVGDTVLSFDEPHALEKGRLKHRGKTIKEVYDQWYNKIKQVTGKKKKPGFIERIDLEKEYTIPELAQLVKRRQEDLRNLVRNGKLNARKIPQPDPKKPSIYVKGSDWCAYADKRFESFVQLRPRIKQMYLRTCNEDTGEIHHTHITNIWESGVKPVFKVTLENGHSLTMSKDHLCLTEQGWLTLEQATCLRLSDNGNVSWISNAPAFAVNGMPLHKNKEWLAEQKRAGLSVADMTETAGVSYHTIRKWLLKHNLQFTEKEKAILRGATLRGRRRNSSKRGPLSGVALENVRNARSGKNSNFWKGGVTSDRNNIGRWTTQNARYVHEQWEYKCAICSGKERLETHHIDPVWNNPDKGMSLSNLISLCRKCHSQIHKMNLELEFLKWHSNGKDLHEFWNGRAKKRFRHANKKLPQPRKLFRYFSKIAHIEYLGEEMTYDLSVEGPYHNFVANGFIVHNSVNEYSTRYSIAIDAAQATPDNDWRLQAKGNRQGSAGFLDAKKGAEFTRKEADLHQKSREIYEERLAAGIAREQARKDLPLSTYTEAYWKIDLHNLLHFLELRMDVNAQYEIRCYADIMGKEILSRWCPVVWEAFQDYRLNSLALSGLEIEIIKAIASGNTDMAIELAIKNGWLPKDKDAPIKRNREREECELKLTQLNLTIPWPNV